MFLGTCFADWMGIVQTWLIIFLKPINMRPDIHSIERPIHALSDGHSSRAGYYWGLRSVSVEGLMDSMEMEVQCVVCSWLVRGKARNRELSMAD